MVAALGLAQDLVGISHECDYPPSIQGVPIIVRPRVDSHHSTSAQIDAQVASLLSSGESLYELDEARLRAAAPDLIITQDLCDVCAITPRHLQQLLATLCPAPQVVTLGPHRLSDILEDVIRVGGALSREAEAERLVGTLRGRLERVERMHRSQSAASHVPTTGKRPRVACLEWLSPLYSAGDWVPDMVEAAGGVAVLAVAGEASQRIACEQLEQADPDVVIVMPCGFTIARTMPELGTLTDQPRWNGLRAVREEQVYVVDALSYFSRPGPRLVDGVEILAGILHPECTSPTSEPRAVRLRHRLPVSANPL
jgi:iron complex transport system substrate-binding protein